MISYSICRLDNVVQGTQIPMPKGMIVSIEPTGFNAKPFSDYRSVIYIQTDEKVILPGEYLVLISYDIGGILSG